MHLKKKQESGCCLVKMVYYSWKDCKGKIKSEKKQIGDVVTVETQAGVMEYKVLDISRSL